MRYLVNFSNQVAAGPRMIAKNFILEACQTNDQFTFIVPDIDYFRDASIQQSRNIKLIYVVSKPGSFYSLFLVFFVNCYLIKNILKKESFDAILAFGNFYLGPDFHKVVVLLHHPYIVDDKLYFSSPWKKRAIEYLKRKLFEKTLLRASDVLVQTNYMKQLFEEKYSNQTINVTLNPNPLSNCFHGLKIPIRNVSDNKIILFYPSRFYPHKNHGLVVSLAKEAKNRKIPIEIVITVDEEIRGAQFFVNSLSELDNIVNVGEITQQELATYYLSSHFLLFPSLSETYGNPIAEATVCGLPAIVPNLGYAKSILGEDAFYFDSNDSLEVISSRIMDYLSGVTPVSYQDILDRVDSLKSNFRYRKDWFEYTIGLMR